MKEYLIHPWMDYKKPFCIFGNLYYIGFGKTSSHLIDTGAGLIIIDPGYPQQLYMLLENIHSLGFDPKDIKYIINTHGHYDHLGATRALSELTGAKTFLGRADLTYATGEVDLTWARECGTEYHEAFVPDVLLDDGSLITLGNTEVLCRIASGHTPGTMAFFFNVTDGEKTCRAAMHGGVGLNSMRREFLEKYNLPYEIRESFVPCIERFIHENVDIVLGNHPNQNDTFGKCERLNESENPFIDKTEWKRFLENSIKNYNKMIKDEGEKI